MCFFVVVVAVVVVVVVFCIAAFGERMNAECICKRRFFSLLLILKSEMLGYIVCVPMDINGGRYFFPSFSQFFFFLSLLFVFFFFLFSMCLLSLLVM